MESNKILEADVLDIIFEQKNKQYGAYELRKNYHKRARKAVVIAAIFAIVVSGIPLIAGLLIKADTDIHRPGGTVTTIRELPVAPPPLRPSNPITRPTDQNIPDNIPTEIVPAEIVPEKETPEETPPADPPSNPGNPSESPGDGPGLNPGPQGPAIPEPVIIEPKEVVEKTFGSEVLTQDPEFPGGEDAMISFLKQHIKYPKQASEAGKDGKVTLEFVVDKNGRISEIDLLRKAGYGFDEEAKRVMGLMPEWRPGKINGEPVKARFQIPIVFEMED